MAGLHHDWKGDAIDNCGTIGGKKPADQCAMATSLDADSGIKRTPATL
jgi:hypothetical protein